MDVALIPYTDTPDHWLHIHKAATSASLAAGIITYGITNISGRAATSALSNTVRIGGSAVSYAGWYVGGTVVGLGLQTGSSVLASTIDTTGEYITMIGSVGLSTLAAIGVGATVMLGNSVYTMYQKSRISQPIPVFVREEEEDDFVVYLEDKERQSDQPDMSAVD